jgi:glutathione S-transferase
VASVLKAPQGAAGELITAQAEVDEALAMLPEIEAKLEQSKAARAAQLAALMQTKQAKVESADALQKQTEAEADLKLALKMVELAKGELEAAVAELHAQEAALEKQKTDLEAKKEDPSGGAVSRGKAASMLSSLLDEDPLPLRKAKISQEAALRRVEREQKTSMLKTIEAAAQTERCKAKLQELHEKEAELEQSKANLDQAIKDLEASYAELSTRMAEAQTVIAELKGRGTSGMGALWWMERSLFEADECLPQSRQKYDHGKLFQFTAPPPGQAPPPSPLMGYKRPAAGNKPAKPTKPTKPAGLTVKPAKSRASDSGAAGSDDAAPVAATAPPPAATEAAAAPAPAPATAPEPVAAAAPAEPDVPIDATLVYFPGRGRGEQIRLALSELGVSWAHKLITFPQLAALKPELAFGSLPMLEIDGLKLVQGNAIMRYLARSFNSHPNSAASLWKFDALLDAAEDLRVATYRVIPAFGGTPEDGVKYRAETLPRHLKQFNALLKSNEFFVDNTFSVADISVFDALDSINVLVPGCLADYPNLEQFWGRIAGRKRIAEYLESSRRLPAMEPLPDAEA